MSHDSNIIQAGPAQQNHGYYTIKTSPGKGNGAFALKDLRAGTRILIDTAFFFVTTLNGKGFKNDVKAGYLGLRSQDRATYDLLPAFTAPGLPNEATVFTQFSSNKFLLSNGKIGCYAHASRFNHSCLPNCTMRPNDCDQVECFVHRDVRAGEELTFGYDKSLLFCTTAERRRRLPTKYLVDGPCRCEICTNADEVKRAASDLRRHMIRQLFLFMYDSDLGKGGLTTTQTVASHLNDLACEHNLSPDWPLRLLILLAEHENIINIANMGTLYFDLIDRIVTNGLAQVDRRAFRDVHILVARAAQFRWMFKMVSDPQVGQQLEASCRILSSFLGDLRWKTLYGETGAEVEGMD